MLSKSISFDMTLREIERQPGIPVLPQDQSSAFNPIYRNLIRQYLRGHITYDEVETIMNNQSPPIDEPWPQNQ